MSTWTLWLSLTSPALAEPANTTNAGLSLSVQATETISKALDDLRLPKNHTVRRRAEALLLAEADAAIPVLIAALHRPSPTTPAIIEVLGRMGRPEAIEPLARFLNNPMPTLSMGAAAALARHPDAAAAQTLRRAASSTDSRQAQAGLYGLQRRADATHCDVVKRALTATDATLRFYAVRAGLELGCIDEDERKRLSGDSSPEIRRLIEANP